MVSVIILAAGEARRMGQPKQLMRLQGQTLIRRAIQTAHSVSERVVVVTGAHYKLIEKEVENLEVTIAHNPDWQTGMGSSIRTGIQKITALSADDDSVIILLCDQPFISQPLLEQLVTVHQQTDKSIVACSYRNTVGVPALFDKLLFSELRALDGKAGARYVISRFAPRVATVDFPEGIYDLDTPEDFNRIKNRLTK